MAMWVKTKGSSQIPSEYINVDAAPSAYVRDYPTSGEWLVYIGGKAVDVGPYATEAEAVEVMRKIVGGVDLRNDLGY